MAPSWTFVQLRMPYGSLFVEEYSTLSLSAEQWPKERRSEPWCVPHLREACCKAMRSVQQVRDKFFPIF